ncbi:hypothetical protein CTI12_AA282510 [Artemisia annua]|uniref:Uncharacterized protein n=1 Tax=Artemisia annua TaxID=35608 RepID=A0A2U1NCJ5_ARTAN|nr:hypothetical protein CTI12_AA282510 [Artemisia annua]
MDSELSQVSVDRTKQAQNTTMFNPDATTSQHNIGLAVALAFEHLKRGDGQQHYIPPGQSQPEAVDGLNVLKAIEKAGSSGRVTSNPDVIVDCG